MRETAGILWIRRFRETLNKLIPYVLDFTDTGHRSLTVGALSDAGSGCRELVEGLNLSFLRL